jgi:hypothetical protein
MIIHVIDQLVHRDGLRVGAENNYLNLKAIKIWERPYLT